MFEIIFLVIVSVYFILSVIFIISSGKNFHTQKLSVYPFVSVIVSVRNEEKNILNCLIALDAVDYPDENIEIIVADDDSTDSTIQIIDKYIAGKNKFKKLNVRERINNLRGKSNVLAQALKSARGEIILVTDADCMPPVNWVKKTVSYYDRNVAAVCGFSYIKASDWLSGIQAIDLTFLLTIASGTANINKPVSCIGNNMSFRKEVYTEVGGYENLPLSVTEDFMLLKAIDNLKKYKILFPVDNEVKVETSSSATLKQLYEQKKRWAVGGLDSNIWGFFIMSSAFTVNFCLLLTPLFFSNVCLYLAVFKIATDFFFLNKVHDKLKISSNLKYFFHFQIYYSLYIIIIPFLILFNRDVSWKGRTY